MLLEYVTPAGEVLTLSTTGRYLREVDGTGVADVRDRSLQTPGRDGTTIVSHELDERIVRAVATLVSPSWSQLHALRRELARCLNPRAGLGTLRYQPDPASPVYEIAAKYHRGAEFGPTLGPAAERLAISFRCPDPAWRIAPVNEALGAFAPGGWSLGSDGWEPGEGWLLEGGGARFTVENEGDLPSWPVFTVTATADGTRGPVFRNETTGQAFSLTRGDGVVLQEGEVLVVDMDRKTARLEGHNVFGYVTPDSAMWALAPGGQDVVMTLDEGAADVSLAWWTRLVGV